MKVLQLRDPSTSADAGKDAYLPLRSQKSIPAPPRTDFPCLPYSSLIIISAVMRKATRQNAAGGLLASDSPVTRTLRTLIYHDGALGDVLLSLPSLQALREEGDELHFVGRPDIGRLLSALGALDDFTSSDSGMLATLFSSGADEKARAFLGRFDRAFLFALKPGSALAGSIARAVPATRTIATAPPEGSRTHVADFRFSQLAGALQAGVSAGLILPQAVRDTSLKLLALAGYEKQTTLIAVQPGSGGKRKCWPLERYFEVALRLSAGARSFILFLSGPAEGPVMRERVSRFVAGRAWMAHLADQDLADVAGLLSRSDLLLGNDSGISHLAAAIGCPVVVLFGPTDPALWSPRGHAVQVLAADTMGAISTDRVAEAAEEMLYRRVYQRRTA